MGKQKLVKMPFIKWSGSKRKQAPHIVSKFPKDIDTYYEPFIGGGSVMYELLRQIDAGNIRCRNIVCSDLNKDLIDIWNIFKNPDTRKMLYEYYCDMHRQLRERAGLKEGDKIGNKEINNDYVRKAQTLFYETRERFNSLPSDHELRPYMFYWLMRTSFNGIVRYNKKGLFNSPFHVGGQMGISPAELQTVFDSWGRLFDANDITFINDSYENVLSNAKEGDLVYMDPPYAKIGGLYFAEGFSEDMFWGVLRDLNDRGVRWLLSYDGISGEDDLTSDTIPNDLYVHHEYVESGQSSFKKLISGKTGMKNKDILKDSLYTNF